MIGFNYNGKRYVRHEGKLYRLPYEKDLRFYGLHECKRWKDGFILGRSRKSKKQLEGMYREVEPFHFHVFEDEPF
jgi:hypothetical protein